MSTDCKTDDFISSADKAFGWSHNHVGVINDPSFIFKSVHQEMTKVEQEIASIQFSRFVLCTESNLSPKSSKQSWLQAIISCITWFLPRLYLSDLN